MDKIQSLLNNDVNYDETTTIDPVDLRDELQKYIIDINIFGNVSEHEIAIGNKNETFKKKYKIVYYPIYLVKDDALVNQIGIYEILVNNNADLLAALDEDGDLDISKIGTPLLYPKFKGRLTKQKADEDDDDATSSEEDDATSSEEDDEEEATSSSEYEYEIWIQNFMNSEDYNIIGNARGGDCLFYSISDGLALIDKKYSVGELRALLADEVSDNLFETWKLLYDDAKAQRSKSLLQEFKFMKNVKNIDGLKKMIKSSNFWGETWSLSTLERLLNIKFILFSKQSYSDGDKANVLQCGQLNDAILEERGIFEPSHYILLSYTGNHYELITYNDKGGLTFAELPEKIIAIILDKCLKRQAGPYYIIPEFTALFTTKDAKIRLK